jgi:crotonobetainyl-CoA:carnitine CoA-transferase CaiB-like acyl-CoA transferase
LPDITRRKTQAEWVDGLAKLGVPSSPVHTIDQVFEDPQVKHRGMKITLPYPGAKGGTVDLIGNPIKFSETPVDYRRAPPTVGKDTDEVFAELLNLGPDDIAALRAKGVV